MKWRGLRAFLKDPNLPFLLAACALAVLFCAGAAVLAALGYKGVWVYVVYAGAAVFLAYAVYLAVKAVPRIRRALIRLADRFPFLRRRIHDYGARTVLVAACAFAFNAAFAVYEIVSACLYGSALHGTLALYYIGLGGARLAVLLYGRGQGGEEAKHVRKLTACRLCGILLVALDVLVVIGAVTQMIMQREIAASGTVAVIVSAVYTFTKLILAIVNLVKAKRYHDPAVQALRGVSAADALMALFSLETAMLAAFGGGQALGLQQILLGSAVCTLIAAIGAVLWIRAQLRLKDARAAATSARACAQNAAEEQEGTDGKADV